MGIRARRSAGVIVGLAGMLGGAMVGLSSVDGATAQVRGTPGGPAGLAAATSPPGQASTGSGRSIPPTHTGASTPTGGASGSSTPSMGSVAGTASPGGTPTGSPKGSPSPTPRVVSTSTATASPTPGPKSSAATPSAGTRTSPTPLPGANTRNPTWKHDSQRWQQWDGAWQDPGWRSEHSRDSRHEHGFFSDRDHFCDRHDCDRFHTDEFRTEDREFRHDCDVLLSFHRVRDLLDFLDGDTSLRDFFELHGDLFDFLVHHPDEFDEFDGDCTFIIVHA